MRTREEILEYKRRWRKDNPERARLADTKWRKRNPEKHKAITRRAQKKHYKRDKIWFANYKRMLTCEFCGGVYPSKVGFHHHDSRDKFLCISEIIGHWRWKRVIEEMTQCMVLCTRCHSRFHGTTPQSFIKFCQSFDKDKK